MANRFAIAPLTTDSSHEDGTATENELEFVRRRAPADSEPPFLPPLTSNKTDALGRE